MLQKIAEVIWYTIMGLFVLFIMAIFLWPAALIAGFGYYATKGDEGWGVPIMTILIGIPLSCLWMAYWGSLYNNYIAGL